MLLQTFVLRRNARRQRIARHDLAQHIRRQASFEAHLVDVGADVENLSQFGSKFSQKFRSRDCFAVSLELGRSAVGYEGLQETAVFDGISGICFRLNIPIKRISGSINACEGLSFIASLRHR